MNDKSIDDRTLQGKCDLCGTFQFLSWGFYGGIEVFACDGCHADMDDGDDQQRWEHETGTPS